MAVRILREKPPTRLLLASELIHDSWYHAMGREANFIGVVYMQTLAGQRVLVLCRDGEPGPTIIDASSQMATGMRYYPTKVDLAITVTE